MASKVYDAFMLFNELDLLEIRLNILDPYVDYFVISECTKTFSGLPKKLFYNENKERYSKFHHKIIHKIVDDCPDQSHDLNSLLKVETSPDDVLFNKIIRSIDKYRHWGLNEHQWLRDYFQRECVLRGLIGCNDEDIIMLSDLDEIPSESVLSNIHSLVPENTFAHLMQKMSQYYINVRKDERWFGTKLARYSYVKNTESNCMRNFKNEGVQLENGGNHLTFLGGSEKIKEKIKSYGHIEFANDYIFNNIESKVNNLQDIFNRPNDRYYKVELDDSFPKYLIENKDKYPQFFL